MCMVKNCKFKKKRLNVINLSITIIMSIYILLLNTDDQRPLYDNACLLHLNKIACPSFMYNIVIYIILC